MCGINAIINFKEKIDKKEKYIGKMNLAIKHRGP